MARGDDQVSRACCGQRAREYKAPYISVIVMYVPIYISVKPVHKASLKQREAMAKSEAMANSTALATVNARVSTRPLIFRFIYLCNDS